MGQVNTSTYFFKRLTAEDDVQSFDCGSEAWQTEVSGFLKDDAFRYQEQGFNVTLLCYSVTRELKGFVSLIASNLRLIEGNELKVSQALEDSDYRYLPCVLIGQFGVQLDVQGQGIGKKMLDWVIGLVTELDIGVRFLTVHVERDNQRGFEFWGKQEFELSKPLREEDDLIYMAYDLYYTPQ